MPFAPTGCLWRREVGEWQMTLEQRSLLFPVRDLNIVTALPPCVSLCSCAPGDTEARRTAGSFLSGVRGRVCPPFPPEVLFLLSAC